MAAKRSGGTAGRMKAKNAAMAADLKARKVERHVGRCPVCHKEVALQKMYNHIISCKG